MFYYNTAFSLSHNIRVESPKVTIFKHFLTSFLSIYFQNYIPCTCVRMFKCKFFCLPFQLDLSSLKKWLNEYWFGIGKKFLTISEMVINIFVPFCFIFYEKWHCNYNIKLSIHSKNVKYISHLAVLNTHTRFNYSCKIKKALRSH